MSLRHSKHSFQYYQVMVSTFFHVCLIHSPLTMVKTCLILFNLLSSRICIHTSFLLMCSLVAHFSSYPLVLIVYYVPLHLLPWYPLIFHFFQMPKTSSLDFLLQQFFIQYTSYNFTFYSMLHLSNPSKKCIPCLFALSSSIHHLCLSPYVRIHMQYVLYM